MDFLDDDENLKSMRETAKEIGLTKLLAELRQEHVMLLTAMDRQRARITKALVLLGVLDPGRK
jgi:hypothetical protein